MNKILAFIKQRPWWSGGIGLIILILIVYPFIFRKNNTASSDIIVKKGTVNQVVSVTGTTASRSAVDLSFSISGRIASASPKVGDQVQAGQVIVALDQGELQGQLLQAEATLEAQQAKLDDLKTGAKPADLDIYAAQVQSSQVAADSALADLESALSNARSIANDAVHTHIDQLISSPRSPSPTLYFTYVLNGSPIDLDGGVVPTNLKLAISSDRAQAENILNSWPVVTGSTASSADQALPAASATLDDLRQIKKLASDMSLALSYAGNNAPGQEVSTIVNTWRGDLSGSQTSLDSAIASVNGAVEKFKSTVAALQVNQKQLASQKAGASAPQISAQEAAVKQAEGTVEMARAQLNKSVIVAPITGIITKQDAKVGQIATPGINLVSIISPSDLEIQANVSEVDIGKIMVGQPVSLTLDAFPGEMMTGHVTYVDPAETIVQGVVNYKIKIGFDKNDPRLKSGLTANLDIGTQTKSNVLVIPNYAVLETDQGTFVRKIESNGKVLQVPIAIGLRGHDGNVEVLTGLSEGDQVQNVGIKTGS